MSADRLSFGVAFFVDSLQLLIDHVCVHLCGGNITVAHELLKRAKVSAVFQQMHRKAMAQRMGCDILLNMCSSLRSPWHKVWLMLGQLIVQPAHAGNGKERIPITEGLTIRSLRHCEGNEAGCAAF